MPSGPVELPPSVPLPPAYPDVYSNLLPIDGDDVVTTDQASVTVSGTTDAVGATGVVTYLVPYVDDDGRGEAEQTVASVTSLASIVDLGVKDADGKELGTYASTLPTAGLAPGLYVAESLVNFGTAANPILESPKPQAEQIVTVAPTDQQTTPVVLAGDDAELTTDGRYLVFQATNEYNEPETTGDVYERDLQTGAEIDLTATGQAPTGTFAIDHDFTIVSGADVYLSYPSFTSANGEYTFGTIHDFDQNPDQGGYNPLPVVTDNATGAESVIGHIGDHNVPVGAAIAASDNGDVVLSESDFDVDYYRPGDADRLIEDPVLLVSYLNPAPMLTIDPVNGTNQFGTGSASVTVTGMSDAVGQQVEIDFGQAGNEVGNATVMPDDTWSYTFDASAIAGPSLYIEASVMSAAGTPARVSETAQVNSIPPTTLTDITADTENLQTIFGPGETLTVRFDTSAPVYVAGTPTLSLSNGAQAGYSGGSGTQQIDFTYIPAITDASSTDLTLTGLVLPPGASIDDASGDPLTGTFTSTLGLTLQTIPAIVSLYPSSESSDFLTNSSTPAIEVGAEANETVTVFDNGTAIGSGQAPDYGEPGITYFDITPSSPLPEGASQLTAIAVDKSGGSSALSSPITITVDTEPPTEQILDLAINGNDDVDLADQANLAVTVTGRVSAPLQAGETVVIDLPGGQTETGTPADGVTGFAVELTPFEAEAFGVAGSVSAYVEDVAGNIGATATQAFAADAVRTIALVSADTSNPSLSGETEPAISGDGGTIAFEARPGGNSDDAITADTDPAPIASGVYIEPLSSGAVTLAATNGDAPALSGDGTTLAYDQPDASYNQQIYVKNLTTGMVTLVSAENGDSAVGGDGSSVSPSLSADGTKVAFASSAGNLVPGVGDGFDAQIYVATLSGGALTGIAAVSVAGDGTEGNGSSTAAALSPDGSEVVFASPDTNLLAAGDPHTANLMPNVDQIYVKALADNAVSGLAAGQVELVSGTSNGSAGDAGSETAAVSANGRYVVFTSDADNLAPVNLSPGVTLPSSVEQVYEKDLLTGATILVSQTANGVVGDYSASSAAVSADGQTVVFSDASDNLGGGAYGDQVYAAGLSDGEVTQLSLLSEPGAIPGDGSSNEVTLSADAGTVAFQSSANNLVAGAGGTSGQTHVYATSVPVAPVTQPPVTLTVTNTNDSGTGSLRDILARAVSGDTIGFAARLTGGTITLASSLTIADDVTVDGLGLDITVDGGGAVTPFEVDAPSGGAVLIEGLTVQNGAGTGIAATDTDLRTGFAGGDAAGGLDLQAGRLTLLSDDFTDDRAIGGTGGQGSQNGGAGGAAAGAILVETSGTLSASNLSISGDLATGGAGGESDGQAGVGGDGGLAAGAIYIEPGAHASLGDLVASGNTAIGGAGGREYGKGAGGSGGFAAGGIYVDANATVSASSDTFATSSGTGGVGGRGSNPTVGFKGAGTGSGAAGAIYVDPKTALSPIDFTYSGNTAGAGLNGDGSAGPASDVYADDDLPTAPASPLSGAGGQDGYIVGATVAYQNASGPSTTTDAIGGFTLRGGTGPIQLTGGTDTATGLAFTDTLTAPAGSTAISPLTTLVEAVIEVSGDSSPSGLATAESEVLAAFKLPSGVDLTTFDAEGSLLAGGNSSALQQATRVFAADNYLESVERLVDAAGGSSVATLASIAQQLAAGDALDLTSPATFVGNAGLPAAASSAVLDIADATTSAVQAQVDASNTPEVLFNDISGGSIAAQRDAVADLAAAAQTGTDAAFQQADSSFVTALPQTLVTDDAEVACFAAGTRIRTVCGDVAIEMLTTEDHVVTASGDCRPVVWTGHRTVQLRGHPRPWDVMPVHVRAHAFAQGRPSRDLVVSPDHAVFEQGVLIPVRYLLNGATIVQQEADQVTWFHVELDAHDVLLAEGLPAESYLDTGNRAAFEHAGPVTQLDPDFSRAVWATGGCTELVTGGDQVARVRRDLLERLPALGYATTDDPDVRIMAGGHRLEPQVFDQWMCVVAPDDADTLRLLSRTMRPAELDARSSDWRRLGIPVAGLRIDGVDLGLETDAFGPGWYNNAEGLRWTDGEATLHVQPGSVVELRSPRFQRYHL